MNTMELRCAGQHYVDDWGDCRANQLSDDEIMLFAGMKACSNCIECMALTDKLTGIGNRFNMNGVFKDCIDSGLPFGIILIDLNNFKRVNDKEGHNKGDEILAQTAKFLTTQTRGDSDTKSNPHRDYTFVPFRQGGDEFAVLATLTTADLGVPVDNPSLAIAQMADRLTTEYLESSPIVKYNDQTEVIAEGKQLGMSIGVSIYEPGKSLSEMLGEAEPIKLKNQARY